MADEGLEENDTPPRTSVDGNTAVSEERAETRESDAQSADTASSTDTAPSIDMASPRSSEVKKIQSRATDECHSTHVEDLRPAEKARQGEGKATPTVPVTTAERASSEEMQVGANTSSTELKKDAAIGTPVKQPVPDGLVGEAGVSAPETVTATLPLSEAEERRSKPRINNDGLTATPETTAAAKVLCVRVETYRTRYMYYKVETSRRVVVYSATLPFD